MQEYSEKKLNGISLIMFKREGCPYCVRTLPEFTSASKSKTLIDNWAIIDTETFKDMSFFTKKHAINGVPTFFLFKDKKLIGVEVGAMNKKGILEMITQYSDAGLFL